MELRFTESDGLTSLLDFEKGNGMENDDVFIDAVSITIMKVSMHSFFCSAFLNASTEAILIGIEPTDNSLSSD